jgi:hypothetical protein
MTEIIITDGPDEWMTTAEFARHHEVDIRTVKRWLQAGRIPRANQDERGRWSIPANAAVNIAGTGGQGGDVSPATSTTQAVAAALPAGAISPVGALVPLEIVAEILDTSVGGVKRLGEAGHLIVGKFGRRSSWRVYIPPTR